MVKTVGLLISHSIQKKPVEIPDGKTLKMVKTVGIFDTVQRRRKARAQ